MHKTLVAQHHLDAAHPEGTGKHTSQCRCNRQNNVVERLFKAFESTICRVVATAAPPQRIFMPNIT